MTSTVRPTFGRAVTVGARPNHVFTMPNVTTMPSNWWSYYSTSNRSIGQLFGLFFFHTRSYYYYYHRTELSGLLLNAMHLDQRSCSTYGPVTGMGSSLRVGKQTVLICNSSHPGWLPATLRGTLRWLSAFGLSKQPIINGDGWR